MSIRKHIDLQIYRNLFSTQCKHENHYIAYKLVGTFGNILILYQENMKKGKKFGIHHLSET